MNFEWLSGVDAVWGTVLMTVAYLALLFWAFRPEKTDPATHGTWRDLRYWVLALVAGQVALYWVF